MNIMENIVLADGNVISKTCLKLVLTKNYSKHTEELIVSMLPLCLLPPYYLLIKFAIASQIPYAKGIA